MPARVPHSADQRNHAQQQPRHKTGKVKPLPKTHTRSHHRNCGHPRHRKNRNHPSTTFLLFPDTFPDATSAPVFRVSVSFVSVFFVLPLLLLRSCETSAAASTSPAALPPASTAAGRSTSSNRGINPGVSRIDSSSSRQSRDCSC